ncbi:hypothetical protein F966_01979 [Acinetobacter higginsii]|uniref:Uncharacterized protein n=1 Tax=Acinetobacter higginsii TaxID=70347 RepID=N8XPE4_9GAMM|nr:hypothetical protein [Acinetobacter higginsii]ENV09323.1 hypothetical protein F966_01979 [Acinetobacter higginsii]
MTESAFSYSYEFYHRHTTSILNDEFTFLFQRNVVDQHQVGVIRGLLRAFLLLDMISAEEYENLSKVITTFDRSDHNHCSHIAVYFASICEVLNV